MQISYSIVQSILNMILFFDFLKGGEKGVDKKGKHFFLKRKTRSLPVSLNQQNEQHRNHL